MADSGTPDLRTFLASVLGAQNQANSGLFGMTGGQPPRLANGVQRVNSDALSGMLATGRDPAAAGADDVSGGTGGPLNDRTAPTSRSVSDLRGGVGGHTRTSSSPGTTNGRMPVTLQPNSGSPGATGMRPDQPTATGGDQNDFLTTMLKSRLDALDAKSGGRMDLTPLLALADAWGGSHLAQAYDRPLTEREREGMKMQLAENLAKRQSDLMWHQGLLAQRDIASQRQLQGKEEGFDAAENRLDTKNQAEMDRLQTRLDNVLDNQGGKASLANDRETLKDKKAFGKDMVSGLASSRSDMGRNTATVTNADKLLQLGAQGDLQKGGLDVRQIHEAAIASAALVSGGSAPAQSTVEALVPPGTADTVQARIEEFLKAEPQGANQMEFVRRMMDTAQREKFLSTEKIKGIKADVLQHYDHLKDADPEWWDQKVRYHFGKDAQFDEDGHYIPKQFQPTGAPAPAQAPVQAPMATPVQASTPKVNPTLQDVQAEIQRRAATRSQAKQ